MGLNTKQNVFLGGVPVDSSNSTLVYATEFKGQYQTGLEGCIFEFTTESATFINPLDSNYIVSSRYVTLCRIM
eukprot:m.256256 g.256256  ORF g.256256 m.256256 type:complete len:73 (+) comp40400_c1_seq63:2739-2957(+)